MTYALSSRASACCGQNVNTGLRRPQQYFYIYIWPERKTTNKRAYHFFERSKKEKERKATNNYIRNVSLKSQIKRLSKVTRKVLVLGSTADPPLFLWEERSPRGGEVPRDRDNPRASLGLMRAWDAIPVVTVYIHTYTYIYIYIYIWALRFIPRPNVNTQEFRPRRWAPQMPCVFQYVFNHVLETYNYSFVFVHLQCNGRRTLIGLCGANSLVHEINRIHK